MKNVLSTARAVLGCAAMIAAAHTQAGYASIGFADITPSTRIAGCSLATCGKPAWDITEIADGVIADGPPFNGFAGLTGATGTISLDLAGSFDIDAFYLWNDINILNEGVRNFRLDFFDTSGNAVGTSGPLLAVSKFAANEYVFGSSFRQVSRVDMVILGVSERVEIREVGFAGAVSAPVPEPGLPAMFGAGLAAVVLLARRTVRKA